MVLLGLRDPHRRCLGDDAGEEGGGGGGVQGVRRRGRYMPVLLQVHGVAERLEGGMGMSAITRQFCVQRGFDERAGKRKPH
jgi:hypothetical protein